MSVMIECDGCNRMIAQDEFAEHKTACLIMPMSCPLASLLVPPLVHVRSTRTIDQFVPYSGHGELHGIRAGCKSLRNPSNDSPPSGDCAHLINHDRPRCAIPIMPPIVVTLNGSVWMSTYVSCHPCHLCTYTAPYKILCGA